MDDAPDRRWIAARSRPHKHGLFGINHLVIVVLNGSETEVAEGATIGGVLDDLEVAPGRRGVAVAVDGEVVPRGAWDELPLADGARVEVVAAIQGG